MDVVITSGLRIKYQDTIKLGMGITWNCGTSSYTINIF